jgi:hypothetical protein
MIKARAFTVNRLSLAMPVRDHASDGMFLKSEIVERRTARNSATWSLQGILSAPALAAAMF